MNKYHIKQIYLLMIIIGGIVSLSVYSTYSIFTLESGTSDIVSIHTPNSLNINEEAYEYKQLTVPKESLITTDIDLYNNLEYELCYSAWYKVIGDKVDTTKIGVYENNEEELTANGVIEGTTNHRISVIIINDNEEDVKVNVGLTYARNGESCALNLSSDKSVITSFIAKPSNLIESLTKEPLTTNHESGYLTYKNITKEIKITNDKVYIASAFNYKDEVFTLVNQTEIDKNEITNYQTTSDNNYYTCIKSETCDTLYRILEAKEVGEGNNKEYVVTKYDILSGYMSGTSGLQKINNNYVYYGDNPNNFIYYNCKDYNDNKTCELWRILGIYQDNDKSILKIIRNDSIGNYKYDEETNIWNDSSIRTRLNKEYKTNDLNTMTSLKYKIENITDLDISLDKIEYLENTDETETSIMSLSDYLNASNCKDKKIKDYDDNCFKNNWLNNNDGLYEWTMSTKYVKVEPKVEAPVEEVKEEETSTEPLEETPEEAPEETIKVNNTVYAVGKNYSELDVNEELKIRPVKYLGTRTFLISGDGTLNNPYVIR